LSFLESSAKQGNKALSNANWDDPNDKILQKWNNFVFTALNIKHAFPHKIIYEEFKKREGTYKIIKESKSTIEELSRRDIKIGMVSNTSETSAEIRRPMLEEHGILNYFETLIFSSEVHYSKPDPKIFLLALEEMQIPSQNVLYVGDSLYHDVNGAENVGLVPVLFDPLRFFSYDGYKIENLLDLLRIVDEKA
ncbi:MAG: HAD family hydrolase, partial [Candidatus Hodarchaeales archaeon]